MIIKTRDDNWMFDTMELDEIDHEKATVIGDVEPNEQAVHVFEKVEEGRYRLRMVMGADTLLSIMQEFAKKGETNAAAS